MSKGVVFSDNCLVNGKRVEMNFMLKSGDKITTADGKPFSVTVLSNSFAELEQEKEVRLFGMHDEAQISTDFENWTQVFLNNNYVVKYVKTGEMSGVVVKTDVQIKLK